MLGGRSLVLLREEVISEARRRKWRVDTKAGIGGRGVRDVLRKDFR